LNPKKANSLAKEVAEKLNVEETLVKDLIEFYWVEVRKAIVNLKHYNIHIDGLGVFRVKAWKIDEIKKMYENVIAKYKSQIDSGEKITMQKFAIMKDFEKKLQALNDVQKIIDADENKRKQIKQKRYEIINKNNLEK
jgi:nucleoid DNA-binding protein